MICLQCLASPSGHCPAHPQGISSGGPSVVSSEPVEPKIDRCPTCGGPVLVLESSGVVHYITTAWADEALDRLLAAIGEAMVGESGKGKATGIADWDEVEDNGLRRSQISAALSVVPPEDEAADCAQFVGRLVHGP